MNTNQMKGEIKIVKSNISGVIMDYKPLHLEKTMQKNIDKATTGFGPVNDSIWNALKKID